MNSFFFSHKLCLVVFFGSDIAEADLRSTVMWDMIGCLDYAHGPRTANDPRYIRIMEIHKTIMYVAADRLRGQYFQTLEETRLGSITSTHRVIDNTKDRQIYLLYKDGVVFEELTRYPEIINIFDNI